MIKVAIIYFHIFFPIFIIELISYICKLFQSSQYTGVALWSIATVFVIISYTIFLKEAERYAAIKRFEKEEEVCAS